MSKPTKFNELQQKLLSDIFRQRFDEMTINNFIFKVCYDNDKLQERINKAIEYIDMQFDNNGVIHHELTKILKGGEQDE